MSKRKNLKICLAVLVMLTGMGSTIAAGGTIYVDATRNGDGPSWANAYKYLQDALSIATNGDEIWVAEGIYIPDRSLANPGGSGDRTATFQLKTGVEIYGGFPVGEGAWGDRDPNIHETILSGDIGTPHVNGDNSYHVVTGSGRNATAVLDGFTITAGNANGGYPYDTGGGMYTYFGSPTVTNCTFSGNSASPGYLCGGGGMANEYWSNPSLTNCTFSGNTVISTDEWTGGGGMFNYGYSSPTVTNCTFSGNEALDYGGAMDIEYDSSPTLTNCILWGNKSPRGPQIALKQNPDANPSNLAISYSDVQGGQAQVYLEGDCTLDWDNDSVISDDPLFLDTDGLDNEIGTEDDNLRLLFSSPCIDAGDNEADTDVITPGVQPLPLIDLDGDPRFTEDPNVPDTGNGTPPIVDMGAYESARGTVLIVLSTKSVTVPEGQTATFDVSLGMDPQGTVEVTVAHQSGDSDITVFSGTLLTFNSSNYWNPQTVTLAAAEDDDDYLYGRAFISVTVPGVVSTGLTAIEMDNEPAPFVLFVDWQASGTNDGSSWTNAFRNLQAALEIARYAPDVEEVRVAAGTYTPAGHLGDRAATFELFNGVAIYGAFPSGGGGGEWG